MAIEIKELIVKTTIATNEKPDGNVSAEEMRRLKKEIMLECSDLIKWALKEQKER